ncbi:hypothetical protein P7K49_002076 [Saguinus oedipus]|uniref:Uncharacterized protein n=1 Tax=Saguinus oedipus TaxID=9490 RepID=A0ABQ9WGW4_SAGOE|nr:hypothetical protein P7K49_002076 [Saguinus oedipus]
MPKQKKRSGSPAATLSPSPSPQQRAPFPALPNFPELFLCVSEPFLGVMSEHFGGLQLEGAAAEPMTSPSLVLFWDLGLGASPEQKHRRLRFLPSLLHAAHLLSAAVGGRAGVRRER